MDQLNIALATIGGLVLVLGLLSNYLRKTIVSENLVALLLGVVLGPAVLGWLDVSQWGNQDVILEHAASLTLAIGLIGIALRLPTREFRRYWQPLATLVVLVMPLMWLVSSLLIYVILGVPVWVALLAGAIITPTDPIVASSIVTGEVAERYLPERIRETLSGESGLNDGLAFPFVAIPIVVLTGADGNVVSYVVTNIVIWQLGGAIVSGLLIGYAAGRLLEAAEAHHAIEQTSFIGYTVALSATVFGATNLIGTDAILAAFMAGIGFDMGVTDRDRIEEEKVQEAVNRFFTLPIFVLVGLTIPWHDWWNLGWAGLALVVAVLLFRRIPAMILCKGWLGALHHTRDALFVGWFGPVAIAALYYASLARQETGLNEIWTIASLIIAASVVVHGITSTPITRRYGSPNAHTSP